MPGEWETYFFMIGSSAAGLIGLLFVVITLTTSIEPSRVEAGSKTYIKPTAYHLGAVVLIGAVAVMPGLHGSAMAVVIAIPALIGLAFAARSLSLMIRSIPNPPHWTDYIYYALLPALAFLCLIFAAIALWSGLVIGPFAVAVGVLTLLLTGLRNAWDLVTYLATHPKG